MSPHRSTRRSGPTRSGRVRARSVVTTVPRDETMSNPAPETRSSMTDASTVSGKQTSRRSPTDVASYRSASAGQRHDRPRAKVEGGMARGGPARFHEMQRAPSGATRVFARHGKARPVDFEHPVRVGCGSGLSCHTRSCVKRVGKGAAAMTATKEAQTITEALADRSRSGRRSASQPHHERRGLEPPARCPHASGVARARHAQLKRASTWRRPSGASPNGQPV